MIRKLFGAGLLFLTLSCGPSCATTKESALDLSEESCMDFSPPAYVMCTCPGTKLIEGMAVKACQLKNPDRWVLIGPNPDAKITVMGGTCVTILDKIQ